MTAQFKRVRSGGVRLDLEAPEAALLEGLMIQMLELFEEGRGDDPGDDIAREMGVAPLGVSETIPKPDDPVLARLFPDAYKDDDEASGEFRRLSEPTLRDSKRAAIAVVITGLHSEGTIRLTAEQAQSWMKAINDVRLAIGTRLDIGEDIYENPPDPSHPDYPVIAIYEWLGVMLDSLVSALS